MLPVRQTIMLRIASMACGSEDPALVGHIDLLTRLISDGVYIYLYRVKPKLRVDRAPGRDSCGFIGAFPGTNVGRSLATRPR